MKKNGKLIFLSILVLGIWGTIGYRVITGFHTGVESIPYATNLRTKPEAKEKIELMLSYPDPFLNQKPILPRKNQNQEKKVIVQKEDNKKPVLFVDWTKVEYIGMVQNSDRNVHIATLRIAGQEYFVREGQAVDIFVVSEITKDSIQVRLQDQVKYIKRKK